MGMAPFSEASASSSALRFASDCAEPVLPELPVLLEELPEEFPALLPDPEVAEALELPDPEFPGALFRGLLLVAAAADDDDGVVECSVTVPVALVAFVATASTGSGASGAPVPLPPAGS